MPNHVTNELRFKGDINEIARMIDNVTVECQNLFGDVLLNSNGQVVRILDFNKVIPEPLTKEECPTEYITTGSEHLMHEDNRDWFNWYNWHIHFWGTKWNAYYGEESATDTLRFCTAWSCPMPVIKELSKQYPSITIDFFWADEDFGYNVGHIILEAGEITFECIPNGGSKEAEIMARMILGYCTYEESEECDD